MKLEVKDSGKARLVTVMEGRIDAAVAIRFKDSMAKVIPKNVARVVVDMSNVKFMDSSGLGAIVAIMKLMGNDRKLELASLTPTVAKVFRLTRMDSIFTIYPSINDAT